MPRISAFYGIVLYMYYEDTRQHHVPHVHAIYGEYTASFAIHTGALLAGDMPPRQSRRVRAWIAARRAALQENWNRTLNEEPLQWIEPL